MPELKKERWGGAIKKVGAEVECVIEFKPAYPSYLNVPWDSGDDPTINFSSLGRKKPEHVRNSVEYRSVPWPGPVEARKDLVVLWRKSRLKANRSCGFHVHVSFKNRKLARLLFCKDFVRDFQKFASPENRPDNKVAVYARWPSDYKNGDVYNEPYSTNELKSGVIEDFAARIFDKETGYGRPERTRMVNYLSFAKHGTIEFRLFRVPKTGVEAFSCVKELVGFVNEWVVKRKELVAARQAAMITASMPGTIYKKKREVIKVTST